MNEDKLKRSAVKWLKSLNDSNLYFYCPTDKFCAGIPDILACYKGRWCWVELKTEKGKVSPIQEWTHGKLRDAGAVGTVARSMPEFVDFMITVINKGE